MTGRGVQHSVGSDSMSDVFTTSSRKFISKFTKSMKPTNVNQLETMPDDDKALLKRILRRSQYMRSQDEVEFIFTCLGHIPWEKVVKLPGLSRRGDVTEILRRLGIVKLPETEIIMSSGDLMSAMYFVLSGEVLIRGDDDSKTILYPGDFLSHCNGAEAGYADFTATAYSVVELIVLQRSDVEKIFSSRVRSFCGQMLEDFKKLATGHIKGFFDGWQFLQQIEDGVRIYKKTGFEGDRKLFKGIGRIERPPMEVADYLMDFHHRRDWDCQYVRGEVLEAIDRYTIIRHDCFKSDSIFTKDRDFCVLKYTHRDSKTQEFFAVSHSVKHPLCPKSEEYVRGYVDLVGFYVHADPEDPEHACQVIYAGEVDPKGWVPGLLVDSLVVDQAACISKIRRALGRHLVLSCVKAVTLEVGQYIKVATTFDGQAIDLWAFCESDLSEYFDLETTRNQCARSFPQVGDKLISNRGKSLLSIVKDSDTRVDRAVNQKFAPVLFSTHKCENIHEVCGANLQSQLMSYGMCPPHIPNPWTLWVGIEILPDRGELVCTEPKNLSGESILLRAEAPVVVVCGCCAVLGKIADETSMKISATASLSAYEEDEVDETSFLRMSRLIDDEEEEEFRQELALSAQDTSIIRNSVLSDTLRFANGNDDDFDYD